MPRVFGTDGVRGLANGQLTAELALDLSVPRPACSSAAAGSRATGRSPSWAATPASPGSSSSTPSWPGSRGAGVDVLRLRVLPTPGVAYFTDALGADVGVVISASHNPMPDNGIKFLARGGVKLDDAVEREIEEHLDQEWDRPTGAEVGRVSPYAHPVEEYVGHLVGTLDRPLGGLRVVLDCAHGAANEVGPPRPRPRRRRGRRHRRRARRPQHQRRLRLHGPRAAAGARWSSTARTPASRSTATPTAAWPSTTGAVVDGDQIMAMLALALAETGRLANDTLVATVMSNLGFVQAMRAAGVGSGRPRSATATCSRTCGRRLHPRRRAVRPRDHERPRHHRRRPPHRAARAAADGRTGRSLPTSPP